MKIEQVIKILTITLQQIGNVDIRINDQIYVVNIEEVHDLNSGSSYSNIVTYPCEEVLL